MKKMQILNSIIPGVAMTTIIVVPVIVHFTYVPPPPPDKVFTKLAKQALEEFCGSENYYYEGNIEGICKQPRESGNYQNIIPYLDKRIKTILGDDLDASNFYSGVDETGAPQMDIMYDIKPTEGCENWKPVVLQDHMDMVLAGSAAAQEVAKKEGITPEIEGHEMHSLNHQTSLGADNGMGIAIMLTLLKNRDKFDHGPIRVICTSDEETTTGGAKILLGTSAFQYNGKTINNLINIDAEPRHGIYRSCAGLFDLHINDEPFTPDETRPNWGTYDLWIGNLNGGHSAWDMENYRANADRLAFEFLDSVNNGANHVQLISYDHTGTTPKSNQIIKNGHLVFATDRTLEQLNDTKATMFDEWSQIYTGDDWSKVQFTISSTRSSAKRMSAAESSELIQYFGSNKQTSEGEIDLTKGLYYGILGWTEQDRRPAASTNIGPITINSDNDHIYLTAVSKTRLVDDTMIDKISIQYLNAWDKIVKQHTPLTRDNIMMPWEQKANNLMLDWMKDAYTKLGIEPNVIDTRGGVEPAYWTLINPNMNCICVGPEIKNAHSETETCVLDTVDPCINALMDVLSRMEDAQ